LEVVMALGKNLEEKLEVIKTMAMVMANIKDVFLPNREDKDELKMRAYEILKRELDTLED